ncbi:hypothetical protein Bca52824_042311 [Brassica carinata]|uniref:Uncharacterized protein n=1 Tax=Brassica carinata TaxID=52824 RepID=A0A8X7RX58_BRACI|nr:hypothetical protein Bca52824_042311 [Brassica carinata]
MTRSFSFFCLTLILCLSFHHHLLSAYQFEGFDAEADDAEDDSSDLHHSLPPPTITQSLPDPQPSPDDSTSDLIPESDPEPHSDPSSTPFDFWDEDEFEGLPVEIATVDSPPTAENATETVDPKTNSTAQDGTVPSEKKKKSYCHGLLATMELKSRHDLISRVFNLVVPCKDEITFEVYMNEETMDHVVFAMAKKKAAKTMQKEVKDLQRFAGIVSPPAGRKWVSEELSVISESKEVAGDMITDTVLDQNCICVFAGVLVCKNHFLSNRRTSSHSLAHF